MKNKYLFLYLAGLLTLISCGTARHASSAGNEYQNGIYYTPDVNQTKAYAQNQEELVNLQNKTTKSFSNSTQHSVYDKKANVETIYIGDTNRVDINYNPNVTYSLVDDDQSYEARLKKFDSPTYTVNIEADNNPYDYYPWWSANFGWYRPYGISWGTGWYNPWWGNYYSWYGPGWYDPWYGPGFGFGHGWNSWYGWGNPWYGSWGHPWYNPWFDPWYGPGPVHSNRDVYYGRRDSSPSYNNRRDPSLNQIRGQRYDGGNYASSGGNRYNPAQNGGTNNGTSYRRRGSESSNGAIYNNNAANSGSPSQPSYNKPGSSSASGSMYRRSTTTNRSSTTSNTTTGYQNNRQNSYNNSNQNNGSIYNRNNATNTYNQNSGSSYSRGSSSSGASSSGTTSGGGGGSSYRRR